MTVRQAYAKDAEAAGRYALSYIHPKRKRDAGVPDAVIAQLAAWAFHWAALALPAAEPAKSTPSAS